MAPSRRPTSRRRGDRTMTLEELKRLDPKKIGSWPALPKLGVLAVALVLILFASYWFDWQHQIEQIKVEAQKEEKLRGTFLEKKKLAIDLPLYKKRLDD